MISDKMAKELNNQIREELYSAYLYLEMSACATHMGLAGTANWFMVQTQEEMAHTRIFYNYLNSQNQKVLLQAIDQPPAKFKTALEMFQAALKHENHVTGRINLLSNLAVKEKDHATQIFLQWFVSEQVEEEENANDIIGRLKLAGTDGSGLFMIDRELAARVFALPSPLAAAGA